MHLNSKTNHRSKKKKKKWCSKSLHIHCVSLHHCLYLPTVYQTLHVWERCRRWHWQSSINNEISAVLYAMIVNAFYYDITARYWQPHFAVRQFEICLFHYFKLERWYCFPESQSTPHTHKFDVAWPAAFSERGSRAMMEKCFIAHIKTALFCNTKQAGGGHTHSNHLI